jgi:hypothetical protein
MRTAVAVLVGTLAIFAQTAAAQEPPHSAPIAPASSGQLEDPLAGIRVDLPVRTAFAGAARREVARDPLAAILVDSALVDPFAAITPF